MLGGESVKKSIGILFLIPIIMIFVNPILISAENENDWTQFRLNSKNNPVIKNNSLKEINSIISTDDEVRSTPVIVGNKMFVGNHDSGYIYAFNIETGEELWRNQAPNWVHSEVIYVNNKLFVGYGNRFAQPNLIRGTGESGLLSLDPKTGEILWDFKTEGEVMPTPAFYKNTVYITTGDEHLYGVNPENGEEKWSLNLGSVISMSSPNIKDGILYVGGSSTYVFKAVDLDEKEMKWETPMEGVMAGLDDVPPVVSDDGIVYTTGVKNTGNSLTLKQTFISGGIIDTYKQIVKSILKTFTSIEPENNYDHTLYALNINNGEIIWKESLGTGPMVSNNKSGAPMLYDSKVFVGSPITQSFYAYDADNGDKLWDYKSNINKAPPVAKDDIVYFADTKGLVYAFDTNSGELKGSKMLGGKLAPSGPILINDTLIVGSQDKNVYSVPTEDILQADDLIDGDHNEFSYIAFIYILPAVVLLAGVLIVYLVIRFWMKGFKRK